MIILAKKTLKWVLITVLNRKIWIKREEILNVKFIASVNGYDTYQILLSDGCMMAPCGLENNEIYEELIKKG